MARAGLLLLALAAFCASGRPPDPGDEASRRGMFIEEELIELAPDAKAEQDEFLDDERRSALDAESETRKALLSLRSALVQELHRRQLSKKGDHLAKVYHGAKKLGKAMDKEKAKKKKKKKKLGWFAELWRKMKKVLPAPAWIALFILFLLLLIGAVVFLVWMCLQLRKSKNSRKNKDFLANPVTYGELLDMNKPPYGIINYSIEYEMKSNNLVFTINNCVGLPRGIESIDPYAVVKIDDEKPGSEHSEVIKSSTNPVFNYTRKFKIKNRSQLKMKKLTVEIYDWDIGANHRMIARKVIKLADLGEKMDEIIGRSVPYTKELSKGRELFPRGVGDICVSIGYSDSKKRLTVQIIECKAVYLQRRFQVPDMENLPNTFVQACFLHLPGKKSEQRKSSLVKQSRNPYFNFSCKFEKLDREKIRSGKLRLELIHKTETLGIKRLVGFLEFSSSVDKSSLAGIHWDAVLRSDGNAISKWHALLPCE